MGTDTVFISGRDGFIGRSTDGGTNWLTQSISSKANLNGIIFLDKNNGVLVGDSGTVALTSNAGNSWSTKYIDKKINLRAIAADGNMKLWVVGDSGKVYTSTDKGNNWEIQNINSNAKLNDVSFLGSTGYIVGNYNTRLRTTNNGSSWVKDDLKVNVSSSPNSYTDTIYDLIKVKQTKSNRTYFMYGSAVYAKSGDGIYLENGTKSRLFNTARGLTFGLQNDSTAYTFQAMITTCGCGDPMYLIKNIENTADTYYNGTTIFNPYNISTFSYGTESDITFVNDTLGYVVFGNGLFKTIDKAYIIDGLNIPASSNISLSNNTQYLTVKSDTKSIYKIEIFDTLGKKTGESQISGNEINYNISSFKKGIYMIRIIFDDQRSITKKWVRQ